MIDSHAKITEQLAYHPEYSRTLFSAGDLVLGKSVHGRIKPVSDSFGVALVKYPLCKKPSLDTPFPSSYESVIWPSRLCISWALYLTGEYTREIHLTFLISAVGQLKPSSCSRRPYTRVHHKKWYHLRLPSFLLTFQLCQPEDSGNCLILIWEEWHWYLPTQDSMWVTMCGQCCANEWGFKQVVSFPRSPERLCRYAWDVFCIFEM